MRLLLIQDQLRSSTITNHLEQMEVINVDIQGFSLLFAVMSVVYYFPLNHCVRDGFFEGFPLEANADRQH